MARAAAVAIVTAEKGTEPISSGADQSRGSIVMSRRGCLLGTALVAMASASGDAAAAAPERCDKYLTVELTPDVPNPRDLAFLSSLLTVPGYQLVWRQQNGTAIEVELTGPGPEDQCRAVIAAMRKDGRVQSIQVRQ
jgi:hypothetical protein